MQISDIFQTPVGTILGFSTKVPNNIIGKYIVSEKGEKYLIKGVPVENDIDIFIEKTFLLKVGEVISIQA